MQSVQAYTPTGRTTTAFLTAEEESICGLGVKGLTAEKETVALLPVHILQDVHLSSNCHDASMSLYNTTNTTTTTNTTPAHAGGEIKQMCVGRY